MTRHVTLTERRRKLVRLTRPDAVALRRDFAGVVTLALADRTGCYEVTAGGYVGTFVAGGTRYTVRPKYPLTYLDTAAGRDIAQGHGDDLATTLARRFTREFDELLTAGLLHGYAEHRTDSPTVRGRLDFARMLRDPSPARLVPIVADEFTRDHDLNRVPRAAAVALLRCDLPADVRASVTRVLHALGDVSPVEPTMIRWDGLHLDARSGHYRPVIGTARAILTGLRAGDAMMARLFNLAAIFEAELTARLAGDRVNPQLRLTLGGDDPRTMRPDFVVRDAAGGPVAVWDAKWKTLGRGGPADDDLHQVLAYAAALGVSECGLIYPARRSARRSWLAPSGVTVHAVILPVTGDPRRFEAAVGALKRRLAGGAPA